MVLNFKYFVGTVIRGMKTSGLGQTIDQLKINVGLNYLIVKSIKTYYIDPASGSYVLFFDPLY
jgi:hypothetical protein